MNTISVVAPTRQRIRAATTAPVVDEAGNVLVAANDNFQVDPVTRAYHMRDSPIERLAVHGRISPLQKQAADRFFADYYNAGLAPLGAVDYTKAIVDGTTPSSTSDFRLSAADRWNKACKALSPGVLKIVDRIVLREMSVEAAGRDVSSSQNAPQARAVAMFALVEGLDVLAGVYCLTTENAKSHKSA